VVVRFQASPRDAIFAAVYPALKRRAIYMRPYRALQLPESSSLPPPGRFAPWLSRHALTHCFGPAGYVNSDLHVGSVLGYVDLVLEGAFHDWLGRSGLSIAGNRILEETNQEMLGSQENARRENRKIGIRHGRRCSPTFAKLSHPLITFRAAGTFRKVIFFPLVRFRWPPSPAPRKLRLS
jgi:hypothetical protein